MNTEPSQPEPALSLDGARHVDRLCDAFEAAWIAGPQPKIDDHLLGTSDRLRRELVRELIQIDLFYRRQQGETPQLSDYSEQFPDVDVGWLESVIAAAGHSRRESGDRSESSGADQLNRLTSIRKVATGAKSDWSPDATKLVVTKKESGPTQDNGLEIRDLVSGAVHDLVARGKDPAWCPAADGPIAFVRGSDPAHEAVWLVRPDGSEERKIGVGGYPQWSADGKTLYFHSRSAGSIMAVSLNDAHAQPKHFFTPKESYYPAVSPDGSQVAYIGASQGLVVVKCPSGEVVKFPGRELVKNWPLGNIIHNGLVVWHPDGKRLAYCDFGTGSGVWLADLPSGKVRRVVGGNAWKPAWSADGKHFLYVIGDDIYVVDSDKLPAP